MLSSIFHKFIKDIKSIPFGVKLIVFVIFLRSFGWGFADPFYSLYLHKFHVDYTVVGLFTAVLSVSALLSMIPLMRLTDKMKETTIISNGELLYFFVIIAYVIAGVFKSIPLLIITLIFAGVAQTFVVVGSEAYIRKHNNRGKTNPFAYYVAIDYLGWIIGMFIAAYGIKFYDLNTMFLFVIPSIIASFFILPRVHERGIKSFLRGIKRYFHSRKDVMSIYEDCKGVTPKLIFFLILAFFDGVVRMFSFIFIPLFGVSINLSLKTIALLMAVIYFPFILSFFFSEVSARFKRMNVIATSLFVGALSFILLYFVVDRFWIVIFAAMISLSMAIVRPIYNGAITLLTPRRMLGEITGFNNLIERLGRIVGPIFTGIIADIYGLPATFLMIAVIAFGLGATSLILRGYDYLTYPTKLIKSKFKIGN